MFNFVNLRQKRNMRIIHQIMHFPVFQCFYPRFLGSVGISPTLGGGYAPIYMKTRGLRASGCYLHFFMHFVRGVRLHTSFLGCSCHRNAYLQDNKKTFSHPERHFGSKIKFLVLDMKLPNSRSFAIIGKENKRGLALEDITSVNVLVYRCNGMWG